MADSEDLDGGSADVMAAPGGPAYADGGLAPVGYGAPGGEVFAPTLPEAPYTIWQVAGLCLVVVLLTAGAMVSYDLARNLWQPEGQMIGSGTVLDFFLKMTKMN